VLCCVSPIYIQEEIIIKSKVGTSDVADFSYRNNYDDLAANKLHNVVTLTWCKDTALTDNRKCRENVQIEINTLNYVDKIKYVKKSNKIR